MAKNILVRAKILKVTTRFQAGLDGEAVTPCRFSPKIIYVSKRLDCAFPCVRLISLHYFLWCPVIHRETKFAFAINAFVILSGIVCKQR